MATRKSRQMIYEFRSYEAAPGQPASYSPLVSGAVK